MTNYSDVPCITLPQHIINQHIFHNEKPDEFPAHLSQIIIDLIKQHGFDDYDSQCVDLLQICLTDFYKDILICFKQHIESLGSSNTMQRAFERTLDDVMSMDLKELHHYMKNKY